MSFSDLAGGLGPSLDSDPVASKLLRFLDITTVEERRYQIRASGLPFCPRRHSLSTVLKKKHLPTSSSEFIDDATLTVGHTYHALLQKWMGRAGTIVGDWQCPGCKTEKKWREGAPRCKTEGCSHYGQDMVYEEIFLTDPETGLTAHPDGLFFSPKGVLEGLEFKTIVQANLEDLSEPYESHLKYQAAAYAYLLNKIRGLRIKHFTFIYISRNLPQSHKVYYFKKGKPLTVSQSWAGKNTLIKMFRCKIDFDLIEKEFEKIKITQKVQKKFGGRLIPRDVESGWGRCESKNSPPARMCSMAGPCFARRIEQEYKEIRLKKLPVLP